MICCSVEAASATGYDKGLSESQGWQRTISMFQYDRHVLWLALSSQLGLFGTDI